MLKVDAPIGNAKRGNLSGASLSPMQFVGNAMYMPRKDGLQKFSFEGRRYLQAIYNTPAQRLLLQCGRQVEKSTSLGNIILTYSMLRENFRSLFVSPAQQQTETFSRDRIATPIELSPILRPMAGFGRATKDNVLYKKFSTGSDITLRYAFLHADRIRGVSADLLCLDEIQDIITDIIPVIEEAISHSDYKIYRYSGTPKSTDNTIAFYWEKFSTQNEWVIPCDVCPRRHWNVITEKSLGLKSLICDKCGSQIYPDHPDAQWASMNPNPNTPLPFEGYRIPQPIAAWIDWDSVIDKRNRYTKQKFYNEVLGVGYDSGDRPLTLSDVEKCCTGPSMDPKARIKFEDVKVFFGIDWGTGENSYTVLTIGAYLGGKFRVIHMHRFEAEETDPDVQIEIIKEYVRHFKPTLIGADYGGGFDRNKRLVKLYGRRRVIEYQYVPTNKKLRFDANLNRFMVNRTEVMMDIFGAIKSEKQSFEFPPFNEFKNPFAMDMVSNFSEYNESRRMTVLNKQPGLTDDGLHSLIYCFLASMVVHPRPDILTPDGDQYGQFY